MLNYSKIRRFLFLSEINANYVKCSYWYCYYYCCFYYYCFYYCYCIFKKWLLPWKKVEYFTFWSCRIFFLTSEFFVSGDSNTGLHKRSIYEHNGVAVCSQKRALCIATVVFGILFAISLIIAFAGPQNGNFQFLYI